MTELERLMNKVHKDESGCWLWTGAKKTCRRGTHRYGWLTLKGKQMNAHRAMWILTKGEISNGILVCHKCDVPSCVNPDHLFLGTTADNMQDMRNKGRHPGNWRGNPKLDIESVRQIRALLADGRKQSDLAKMFDVTTDSISNINTGKTWSQYA